MITNRLCYGGVLLLECVLHTGVTFIADEDLRGAGRDNLKKHSF